MLSRRAALWGAASLAAMARAGPARTFVLVPGAWHGGWAFSRLGPLLERGGHRVDAVTLPGLAERAAELTPTVRLATHVDDVVARIERAPGPVVLVGHSYAGVVVMPAAARVAERLERLVLLDAFVATPGASMLSLMKPSYAASWRAKAKSSSGGLSVPPMLDAKAMGVTDADDARWVNGQLTPHPLATLEEPAEFDPRALEPVPKRYLWCARYPGFKRYAELARRQGWDVRELDAGHDAMITAPDVVARALL